MKLIISVAFFAYLIAVVDAAAQPQKQVLITYPPETPDSIIQLAKDAILEAGGKIVHEYELIRGFAASASAKVLETVDTLSAEFKPLVEEDQVVTIQSNNN